jgi:hypothetical protein
VAAPALLTKPLQFALPHEGWESDVHIADPISEVVGTELANISCTIFNLQLHAKACLLHTPWADTVASS